MIIHMRGSLFDTPAQTLVNPVNTVGVMGKGLALQFKQRDPAMFADYRRACQQGAIALGRPYLYRSPHGPWVVQFPTKRHWRDRSRLSDIAEGLRCLADHCDSWGITSLAVPALGCGLGGLDWYAVRPLIVRALSPLTIPVWIVAPDR